MVDSHKYQTCSLLNNVNSGNASHLSVILPPCALWLAGICVPVVTTAQIFLGRMVQQQQSGVVDGRVGEELRAE